MMDQEEQKIEESTEKLTATEESVESEIQNESTLTVSEEDSTSNQLPHDGFDDQIRSFTEADLESELATAEDSNNEQLLETTSENFDGDAENLESADESSETATELFYQKCELPLKAQIEAVLFASQKCLHASEIAKLILIPEDRVSEVEASIQELTWEYQQRAGGFRLEQVRGHGFQFRTVADAAPLMKRMFASRPRPLSRASLETLSIIAYRQPVTRAEIEFVRGVDAGSIIKHLLERNLVACVGRKEEAGRPMLFGTTAEFLQVFGFSSVKDLPSLTSFQAASETIATNENVAGEEQPDIELPTGDFMDHSDESRNQDVSAGMMEEEESVGMTVEEESAEQTDQEESVGMTVEEQSAEQTEQDEVTLNFSEGELDAPAQARIIQGATRAESFEKEETDTNNEQWDEESISASNELEAVKIEVIEDEVSDPQ